jgi:hypothetical protein
MKAVKTFEEFINEEYNTYADAVIGKQKFLSDPEMEIYDCIVKYFDKNEGVKIKPIKKFGYGDSHGVGIMFPTELEYSTLKYKLNALKKYLKSENLWDNNIEDIAANPSAPGNIVKRKMTDLRYNGFGDIIIVFKKIR